MDKESIKLIHIQIIKPMIRDIIKIDPWERHIIIILMVIKWEKQIIMIKISIKVAIIMGKIMKVMCSEIILC